MEHFFVYKSPFTKQRNLEHKAEIEITWPPFVHTSN
jgi:hypothetical protein